MSPLTGIAIYLTIWWTALFANASVAALLVVNGVHALWALGLAVLSLGYRSGVRGWERRPSAGP